MMREMETWLLDSRVSNNGVVEQSSLHCIIVSTMSCLTILGVDMQAVEL